MHHCTISEACLDHQSARGICNGLWRRTIQQYTQQEMSLQRVFLRFAVEALNRWPYRKENEAVQRPQDYQTEVHTEVVDL